MNDPATTKLLDRAAHDDGTAVGELMALHRFRIRKMLAIRMHPNLSSRVDPSDVVQEALIEASRQLPQYLEHRRIGFYPWLRDVALNCLIQQHRRHVLAAKRSTKREQRQSIGLSNESCMDLAGRLIYSGTSPSGQAQRSEDRHRVTRALEQLADEERELLVMKYLEELTAAEICEVLGVTERTVWRRHAHAIERLGWLLEEARED